jgi:hypothetical protein
LAECPPAAVAARKTWEGISVVEFYGASGALGSDGRATGSRATIVA